LKILIASGMPSTTNIRMTERRRMLIANHQITIERLRNDGPSRHAGSNPFTFGGKGVEKISNCRAGVAGCQFWVVE
jgi:hypothetical protein